MKFKHSKRRKNGFTMVELLAVVAILGVIVAIAVPVSLSYVRNSRDKAFYLNVQEIVKKVKMENELHRGRHCYYNITEDEIATGTSNTRTENAEDVANQTEQELVKLIGENIKNIAILSYEDNGKTKYAVLAQEKETGDWMDVLDFDSTTSEKTSWDDFGASYVINKLSSNTNSRGTNSDASEIGNTFGTELNKINGLSKYQADIEKCTLDFKEGN